MKATLSLPSLSGPVRVPGAELARFMELRGRRIVEACGALWHSVGGRFYMSLPYQFRLDPDLEELEEMMRKSGASGVRFPSLTWPGLPSGVYLFRHKRYDIDSVHAKQRSRVRRGLERFQIREVDPDELLAQGLVLNLETMERQGRYDPEFGEVRRWRRLVAALRRCPAVKAIGTFAGDRLAGYMITCCESGCLHILHQMSRREDLKDSPNHALTFHVTKQAAEDPELESCCYGSLSLVNVEGLHEYKLRFGYELVTHNSAIHLHPLLAPVLGNPLTHLVVQAARAFCPRDQTVERLETIVRGARLTKNHAHLPDVDQWCAQRPGNAVKGE